MVDCFLSLSSNRDALNHFQVALKALDDIAIQVQLSSLYRSDSVTDGPAYTNQVLCCRPNCDQASFNAILKKIENDCGRDRAQRSIVTLDLDILLWRDGTTLTWIHDDIYRYSHAIAPLAEIAPEIVDPKTQQSLLDLAAQVAESCRYSLQRLT